VVAADSLITKVDPHQYRPCNPECQPYWDVFYNNPYPDKQERQAIAEKLGSTYSTITQWFKMARRYTHAPDNGPDSDAEDVASGGGPESESESESERSEYEVEGVRGTLYEHFYRPALTKKQGTKRSRSDTITAGNDTIRLTNSAEVKKPKTKEHQLGPRGLYKGNSRMTAWRNNTHARKHASDIRNFFPSVGGHKKAESSPPDSVITAENDLDVESGEEGDRMDDWGVEESREVLTEATDSVLPAKEECRMTKNPEIVQEKVVESLITIDEYQAALTLLQTSMNDLKLDLEVPNEHDIEEESKNEAILQNNEGPTLEDAEHELQESTALLDNDEDDAGSESFYSALNRHLQRLLAEEKKSKTPNVKTLIELTTISDYNNLRETYRNTGCRAPSTRASNQIAEAKFTPTAEKPVYSAKVAGVIRLRYA
ncbi:hypothetical protein FRC07_010205, partial [Ceratobasidium sp. 392]